MLVLAGDVGGTKTALALAQGGVIIERRVYPSAAYTSLEALVSEFLGQIELNIRDLRPLKISVTYQEPCHLAHAQRITAQPRKLLKAIPQLALKEMHESSLCCGSAGIYNITEPEMAQRLAERQLDRAEATGADMIVTANPGCHLQLAGGLRRRGSAMRVRHIVEVLDEAYHPVR